MKILQKKCKMLESRAKTSLRSQIVTSEAKHTIPVHGPLSLWYTLNAFKKIGRFNTQLMAN